MAGTHSRAAPPDDGGTRGSYTRPGDSTVEAREDQNLVVTERGRTTRGKSAGDLGVTMLVTLLIVGALTVFAYCSMVVP
jgi:hypothetical protein